MPKRCQRFPVRQRTGDDSFTAKELPGSTNAHFPLINSVSDELTKLSLVELVTMMKARAVSPVEVAQAYLDRIGELNPWLNAIVTLASDVMAQAELAEKALMRGEATSLLHGVPLTIKDTIETAGLRTTSGSRVREQYVPVRDAQSVSRLREAGAIILGKTNVAEMAAAYDTENPVFGRANNPYDLARTTGGSSGGEGSAIAACLSAGGIGSDLMGSIRVPAHFCGITGLKPTSGRVPGDGHFPVSKGILETGAVIGPMARNVSDLAALFAVLCGDAVGPQDLQVYGDRIVGSGTQAAWYTSDGVSPVTAETIEAVKAAAAALDDAGFYVREARPPGVERGPELCTKLFARAASSQMRIEYSGRESEAGPLVRHLLNTHSIADDKAENELREAIAERGVLRAQLIEWMDETAYIIAPIGSLPAFPHGARKVDVNGESVTIFRAFSYSQTWNALDFPAVCVPAGRSQEGLPIGVQIVGRPNGEYGLLAVAAIVERALGGWKMPSLALSTKTDNPL